MGSRTRLVLPDGSTVWLNAGSRLTYSKDFGSRNRNVTLTGEAYFDVTKSAELPFVIQTPAMQVKVVGTAFNIKSYPGERTSETSVIRGSVEIIPKARPGEKYVLKPNEKLVVANAIKEKDNKQPDRPSKPLIALGSLTYYPADSLVVETSWVDNKLVFDNEAFSDVALKMERWYGMTIEFRNKQLQEMRLTGSFVNETIYEALNALQISGGFNYSIRQNTVVISK
jgi:ferric-dicitrate binding protein FerR (iron transport regulator)